MKYQILFVACVLFFATTTVQTVEANPLVETMQTVKSELDDLIWLAQNPTLENALYVLKRNGWGKLAPYVGGYVRMMAYDEKQNGKHSGKTAYEAYQEYMTMIVTMIDSFGNKTVSAY